MGHGIHHRIVARAYARASASHGPARASTGALTFETEILPALRWFYAERGHTCVPRAYAVPSNAPRDIAGVKLGARVDRMRARGDFLRGPESLARVRALDDVGAATGERFPWDAEDFTFYKQIVPCLRHHARTRGHLNVGIDYETPSASDDDDVDARALKRYNLGFPLGKRVNDIRAKGTFVEGRPDRFERLSRMEFVWDDAEYQWDVRLRMALEMFRRVHGHLNAPANFVVPEDAMRCPVGYFDPVKTPSVIAGFPLGNHVAQIRSTRLRNRSGGEGLARSKIRQLDRLGFVWDVAAWEFHRRLLPSVRHVIAVRNELSADVNYRVDADVVIDARAPLAIFDYPVARALERLLGDADRRWPVDRRDGLRALTRAFIDGQRDFRKRRGADARFGAPRAFHDARGFFARAREALAAKVTHARAPPPPAPETALTDPPL